jgi:hypothetical protein
MAVLVSSTPETKRVNYSLVSLLERRKSRVFRESSDATQRRKHFPWGYCNNNQSKWSDSYELVPGHSWS